MSQRTDEQDALKAARGWFRWKRETAAPDNDEEDFELLVSELAALIFAQRQEAIDEARPRIEGEARIKALEWAYKYGVAKDWKVTACRIEAEITRLKAEGGSVAPGR